MLTALQELFRNHTVLCCYFLAVNIIAFIVFTVDKIKAIRGSYRIPESVLFGLSAIGGAAGSLLAMLLARHKIRKPEFMLGVPVMLLIWIVLILLWLKIITV